MFSYASKHNDPKAHLGWSERIGYGIGNYGMDQWYYVCVLYAVSDQCILYRCRSCRRSYRCVQSIRRSQRPDYGRHCRPDKVQIRKSPGMAGKNVHSSCHFHAAAFLYSFLLVGYSEICLHVYLIQSGKFCFLYFHVRALQLHELPDDPEHL